MHSTNFAFSEEDVWKSGNPNSPHEVHKPASEAAVIANEVKPCSATAAALRTLGCFVASLLARPPGARRPNRGLSSGDLDFCTLRKRVASKNFSLV